MPIRGSGLQFGSSTGGSTINIPLPTGSLAGDMAFVFFQSEAYIPFYLPQPTPPAGWTALYTSPFPSTVNCVLATNTLTSTDISLGHISIVDAGTSATGDYAYSIVVLVGGPYTIRETDYTVGTGNTSITTGSLASGDGALYFAVGRGQPDPTVLNYPCLSRGVVLVGGGYDAPGPNVAMGISEEGFTAAGTYTVGFSFTQSAPGGETCLVVVIEGAGFDPAAPAVLCGSPINGAVGDGYTHTFPTENLSCTQVFTISSGSLPPGLTLNSSTGVVSGTPTAAGTYTFTVSVAYGAVYTYPDLPLPFSVSVSCSITTSVVVYVQPLGLCVEMTPFGLYVHSDVYCVNVVNLSGSPVAISRRNVYLKVPTGGSGGGASGNVAY